MLIYDCMDAEDRASRSNCREQLNSEFFALLSTRFSILKIVHLIMRIGIINKLFQGQ